MRASSGREHEAYLLMQYTTGPLGERAWWSEVAARAERWRTALGAMIILPPKKIKCVLGFAVVLAPAVRTLKAMKSMKRQANLGLMPIRDQIAQKIRFPPDSV